MVSAFAARQRIVLGQVKVNEKSNDIIANPALLDMMSIERCALHPAPTITAHLCVVVRSSELTCNRRHRGRFLLRRPIELQPCFPAGVRLQPGDVRSAAKVGIPLIARRRNEIEAEVVRFADLF